MQDFVVRLYYRSRPDCLTAVVKTPVFPRGKGSVHVWRTYYHNSGAVLLCPFCFASSGDVSGDLFHGTKVYTLAKHIWRGPGWWCIGLLGLWLCWALSLWSTATAQAGKPPDTPSPCPAAAQDTSPRVLLQSETLEFLQPEKRVVATGNVVITYGDKRVSADHLEFHTDTNTGTAWGHVRLQTPDDDLQAGRIDFDFTTERGVLYDSSGKASKIYRIAGERIERVGPQSFKIQQGRITTCSGRVPDWEFRSADAQLEIKDYITMQHPSFWIKGIPVFYVPYFIVPVKDKRTTGFLPPRFGVSEQFGNVIGEEFFWAINDWMDATAGVEYLSKKGWKPEVEYRYALDPQSDGQLKGAFLRERDTGLNLWRVLLQQRQDFGWGIRGVTQIDVRSEGDLARRFARTIEEESAIRTASLGALTKVFPFGGITLSGASYDGIPDSGSTQQFRYLPSVRISQFPTALPWNLFFSLETSYNQLSSTDVLQGTAVQRLDVFPRVSWPVALPPWAKLTLTGGVHETLYDHRLQSVAGRAVSEGRSIVRHVPDVLATLEGPMLRRRYVNLIAGQDIIHVMTPRVAYRYVPVVRQHHIPPFETLDETQHFLDPLETYTLIDRIQAANYAKFALVHRLYVQGNTASGTRSVREVARLILSQGADLRQATEDSRQVVGPLDIELDLRLWPRWWLVSTLRVAPRTGALQELLWQAGVNLWPGASVTVTNFQRQDPDVHYVHGGLQFEVLQGLRLAYNLRYDARLEEFREHLVALHYQADCWRVDARFRLRAAGDTDFFVQINLLNL